MKTSFIQRFTMSLPELEIYHRERRIERFLQGHRAKNIRIRSWCYPIFRIFLLVDRKLRKQTITILNPPPNEKQQIILACTHIGQNDLENIYETIGRSCWWFVGDPCLMYQNIAGLFAYLNGVIFLDTGDKTDRNISYMRAVDLLKRGGSLMIYPEGARNGSENLPVMPLFPGTARMAIETDTSIIPVAIEQYEKRFVINFGKKLPPENYQSERVLTQALRNTLATLKWEIWEQEGIQSRAEIPENYSKQFVQQFAQQLYPYDTLESVERTRFHTSVEIAQKEVVSHLGKLILCKENAFLWRKR